MKHNSLISANGFHNPIAPETTKSCFLTAIFKPLLLLFLLVMGSSVVWAASVDCSFTQGETIYFRLKSDINWGDAGGYPAAVFYYSSNSNKDTKSNTESYSNLSGTDAKNIGSGNYTAMSLVADRLWSVTIPRNDIGYICIIRVSGGDSNWLWAGQNKMCVTDAGSNNCIYCNVYSSSGTWETYGGGRTSTCGDSGPTLTNWSFRGDMWLNGTADDAGWLGGSSSNVPHFMDNGDGTATCSFVFPDAKCRLSLDENGSDKTSDFCDGATGFTKSWSSNKYTFTATGGTKKYTFTLNLSTGHFTASAGAYTVQKTGWHVFMSSGDGDPTEVGTITEEAGLVISNVASGNHNLYITDGSATTIAGVNWFGGLYIDKTNSDVAWATQREYYGDGKFSATEFPIKRKRNAIGRFKLNETSDITVAFDGGKITINKAVAPDPSLQPWSGDSYRDWYLTGDFSNPGVFDAWVQNPSAYKFAADGDNHQKVSITLDPNDASIFHDNSGHKLTRFEIIRQGTWDDPRINKPQFDATTSNCSLQTDWIQPGSNRMSLELTTKSVIEFDIWRWGTAPGSADRKVTVTITPVPQVTVTFMANGKTFATQTFDKGGKASIPAGTPARSGYNFNGWDWDFNTTVNENTTIDATWAYKAISSVVLNESTHMTWVGNTDFTLTPTYDPSDLITKDVAWSSDNTSVATVSNGTVHAEGAGSATITCTVTDQFDHQETATCEVTVAACEMATDNIYSMTVTGYNSSTGSSATLTDLWNESTDNDGPASLTMYYLTITPNTGGKRYLYADESDHYVKRNTSSSSADNYYWIKEKVGKTGNNLDIYTIKNYGTDLYLASDDDTPITQNWYAHRAIVQADGTSNVAKWHYIDGCGAKLMNVAFSNGDNSYTTHETFLHVDLELGYGTINYHMNDESIVAVGSSDGCQNRQAHRPVFEGERVIDNPNHKASLMNGSYYRMKENATVQANLTAPLMSGAVITVRLYADAATTVKLQKTDGTEIETINLTADTEREYTYTGSALVGESAFVIKATDNHAGIASIVVTRTYAIRLAQLIDETEIGGTLTLTCDYATDNAVINKAITINGQGHTIGNLTVEQNGDLTLSSALTVNDFTICAKAGNTSIPAASGQVRNANNLTVSGNAYFLYTVDPSGRVQYGWYDFTVPFHVNAASGIKGIQEDVLKENFAYGPDYAIMDYDGAKQAQGQYPYKKFSGIMQPNKLYSITLDDDYNYNTLRMQKTADGALVAGDDVTLEAHDGDELHKNWNGVGNGTLHHADAGNLSSGYVQVYQSGSKTFLPVNKNDYSFVVGTAFMVQETGTMTLSQATHGALLAPSRYESAPATAIQIASEGQPFSDQLFITASETGGQAYTPGTDLAKAGTLGSANVPQIWTTAYNNPLCVHEAQLIDGEASYNLSLYAPAAGSYTLTSLNIPADYSLYLTQDGTMLGELNGTYTLDLNKGITTKYGLLLVETYKTPTGMEEISSRQSEIRKIMHNGVLYILHNGKIYNAQGAKVK